MIRLIVCGAAGRMGKEILSAVEESDDIRVTAGIEASNHESIGKVFGNTKIVDNIESVIEDADCIVDFTNHKAAMGNLEKVKVYKKPFVTGTTGFSKKELADIETLAKGLPVFLSPNMSVGVNYLYNLVKSSARVLENYDIEVIETHHRAKKDAPSGTAKAIAKVIKQARPEVTFIYGRKGFVGGKNKNEVCINSIRGGDIVGEHRVLFLGDGEFIELRHYATSRRCFAVGTLDAVRFIVDKAPGLYAMKDMLGVN